MEQFRNKPEAFKEIRKQSIMRGIPIMLLALAGGFLMGGRFDQESAVTFLPTVVIGLIAVSVGFYIGIKRQKEIFESYVLSIDESSITREQKNTPTIKLQKTDIVEIIKIKNGNIAIRGNKAGEIINVYAKIDNYESLERQLIEIKSITLKSPTVFIGKLLTPVSVIFTLGLMVIVYTVSNKIIVGISGTLLTGIMVFSFFKIQSNKNVDVKTKRGAYWLIFVLFSVIAVTILKLLA